MELPPAVPWIYQPPGQPAPWMAITRPFHPFGGVFHEGDASAVGSNSTVDWKMPRSMVAVSTRTMKFTVLPASVVVLATSAGGCAGSGSTASAVPPFGK